MIAIVADSTITAPGGWPVSRFLRGGTVLTGLLTGLEVLLATCLVLDELVPVQ